MMRAATILWAALAAVAGTGLFMLKYEVQAQEQRLSGLHKDIIEAQEQIHVLKAEWSYLNEPARLREQAERHLGLHPLKPSQITTIAALPMREPLAPEPPVAAGPQVEPQAAPAVVIPETPVVTRRSPGTQAPAAGANATSKPKQAPAVVPKKPARSMTAQVTAPAAPAKSAAARPAPMPTPAPVEKPTAVVKAAAAQTTAIKPARQRDAVAPITPAPVPAPAQRPAAGTATYASAPASKPPATGNSGTSANAGNVMVIKSPALAEPEVASTRVRP